MEMIGKTISINRGNSGVIRVKLKTGEFKIGDTVKFSIVDELDYNNVKFQKIVTVEQNSPYAYIYLEPDDTRFDEIPYNGVQYRYEILYNREKTLIGADRSDNNIIIIFAEAGDK